MAFYPEILKWDIIIEQECRPVYKYDKELDKKWKLNYKFWEINGAWTRNSGPEASQVPDIWLHSYEVTKMSLRAIIIIAVIIK